MSWFLLALSVATNVILLTLTRHCRTTRADRDGWRNLAITSRRRAVKAEDRANLAERLLVQDLMGEANQLTGGDT